MYADEVGDEAIVPNFRMPSQGTMVHQDHLIAYTAIMAHMRSDHDVTFSAYYCILTLVHRTMDGRRFTDSRTRSDFNPARSRLQVNNLRLQADDGIRKNPAPLPYNGRPLNGCVLSDFAAIPKNHVCTYKSPRADFQILPELCFRVDIRGESYIVHCLSGAGNGVGGENAFGGYLTPCKCSPLKLPQSPSVFQKFCV